MPDPTDTRVVPRASNRDETRTAILLAAHATLAYRGFSGFGVHARARESGYDKHLVYRHFGGLDGLIDARGEALATWVADRLRPLLTRSPDPLMPICKGR